MVKKKRNPPVKHVVKKHYRQGTLVESFPRGTGQKTQKSRKSKIIGKTIPSAIPFKIKITYSKYEMKTEHEVLTTGLMRGMGYRSRERTMKVRVTIPWLKLEYEMKLDGVMANIGFYPTKKLHKERERNDSAYLHETSTLHSHTKEDQSNNLAEYTKRVQRVLDKLYDEEKEWEPDPVR